MNAIELNSLTKWYGPVRGAEDVSFSVECGEIFGYLGPNGAGKTTTLRCSMGFLKPSSGEVRVFGETVRLGKGTCHDRIGFLPGDFKLWPSLTARKALMTLSGLDGRRNTDSKRREVFAERLGLNLDRPMRYLSKGNRQKVGLIAAFQHDPDLLILDEPTTGLDPLVRVTALDMIREAAARGATILFSSHDLEQVAAVCHRTAILREGRLVELAPVETILAQSEQQIKIWFEDPVQEYPCDPESGVRVIEQSDRYIHLAYHGSPDVILRWAAGYSVKRLLSPEATLEEAFLHYFNADDTGKVIDGKK